MSDPYQATAVVAVLGGGQLGTMLAEAAQPLRVAVHCLDPDPEAPASYNAQAFAEGSFRDARTVEAFAKTADAVTVEIESVSTEGLAALRDVHGRSVHPRPEALALIQDKGLQKRAYAEAGIPTAPFALWGGPEDVREQVAGGALALPFVQKSRRGGYDGRGVRIVRTRADLDGLLPGPCLVEEFAAGATELAVVAARRPSGEVATYPVVEMDFDPAANLVTQLISPARISGEVADRARAIAVELVESLDVCGLLAVEFFLLPDGRLWVNEVAPRPHNSGHVTQDGFATSQFEQHLRAVLDLPLGATDQYRPAVMVNLLGEPDADGEAAYAGLPEALSWPGVHVHLYGKARVRPGRKMGHVNVVAEDLDGALATAARVRSTLRCVAAAPRLRAHQPS